MWVRRKADANTNRMTDSSPAVLSMSLTSLPSPEQVPLQGVSPSRQQHEEGVSAVSNSFPPGEKSKNGAGGGDGWMCGLLLPCVCKKCVCFSGLTVCFYGF